MCKSRRLVSCDKGISGNRIPLDKCSLSLDHSGCFCSSGWRSDQCLNSEPGAVNEDLSLASALEMSNWKDRRYRELCFAATVVGSNTKFDVVISREGIVANVRINDKLLGGQILARGVDVGSLCGFVGVDPVSLLLHGLWRSAVPSRFIEFGWVLLSLIVFVCIKLCFKIDSFGEVDCSNLPRCGLSGTGGELLVWWGVMALVSLVDGRFSGMVGGIGGSGGLELWVLWIGMER